VRDELTAGGRESTRQERANRGWNCGNAKSRECSGYLRENTPGPAPPNIHLRNHDVGDSKQGHKAAFMDEVFDGGE